MLRALTRSVSPAIANCELTHVQRAPIDHARAVQQHAAYQKALVEAGCTLVSVSATPELPDSVFVEDTAVVAGGVAVLTRPGAESRRPEVDSVGSALEDFLPTVRLEAPATLDGGDVLLLGDTLYVGTSARTNEEGIRQLRAAVDLDVVAVPMKDALHLKTAVTALDPETILVQPRWVDASHFGAVRVVEVDPLEPFAANTLRIGDTLIIPAAHARTADICSAFVPRLLAVEADELAKAEGGVTCCSIVFDTEA